MKEQAMKRVGIGIIGAGAMGRLRADTVSRNDMTVLTGVADVDKARAVSVAGRAGARAFDDYREMLGMPGLDVVIVSSPVHLHEEMAVTALLAGKHVLCEKPLSNSAASCRRILGTAAQVKKIVAVGFNFRYFPSFKYMNDVVKSGAIGAIDHVRALGGHHDFAGMRDWMYRRELLGGGAMMDIGIHLLDLLGYLLGDVAEVYGVTSTRIWKVPGSEDNAMVLMKTVDGIPITYQSTWSNWPGYRFWIEVYGERGMVRGQSGPMFNRTITQDRPGGKQTSAMRLYPTIALREKFLGWQTTVRISFAEELADLLRRIDGDEVDLADGRAGLRAVTICEAVYESSETGKPVRVADGLGQGD